jgi:hypothetical protein
MPKLDVLIMLVTHYLLCQIRKMDREVKGPPTIYGNG